MIKNVDIEQLLQFMGEKSLILIFNITCNLSHCMENPDMVLGLIGARLAKNPKYNFAEFLGLYIEYTKTQISRLK